MPIFMDRHYVEGATKHTVGLAHEKDIEVQDRYGVNFITYWFDEARHTAFCLVAAPNKEAVTATHQHAHGLVPTEIIEVDPTIVDAFLGRMKDPVPAAGSSEGVAMLREPAFRAIMFTDLKDSTAMTTRLGDSKALHLLHIHNALTRNALREHNGREVKHTGDGLMASFACVADGVHCASAIQKAFAAHNDTNPDAALYVRIGMSAGEPVEEDNDLFGVTVQLASRTCAHAKPSEVLVTHAVREHYEGEPSLFVDAGRITPKGFDEAVQVYAIDWRAGGR